MDDFEERKSRLVYRQNLTVGDVVGADAAGAAFRQQHNSKLTGKFEEACHDMGVEFRPSALEPGVQIELRRGRAAPTVLDDAECRRFDADVCFGCRNVYVAGVNMRVRVEYGRRRPPQGPLLLGGRAAPGTAASSGPLCSSVCSAGCARSSATRCGRRRPRPGPPPRRVPRRGTRR